MWKYDITSDTWTAGPPLPEPRAGVAAWPSSNENCTISAATNRTATPIVPTTGACPSTWANNGSCEADLPDPRGHVSAAVLDGKIYALGGAHGHDKTQIDLSDCERFDPATGKWQRVASLPDGRSHFEGSTFMRKGRIVIVAGRCNSTKPSRNVVGDLLEYDPTADTWSVIGTLPEKVLRRRRRSSPAGSWSSAAG